MVDVNSDNWEGSNDLTGNRLGSKSDVGKEIPSNGLAVNWWSSADESANEES